MERLSSQLQRATNEDVKVISGGETCQATTSGFSNFGGTNVYKPKQLEKIGEMFRDGSLKMVIIFHNQTGITVIPTALYGRTIGC